jgi:hypothetical protein
MTPRMSAVLLWMIALVTLAFFAFFVALVAGAMRVGDQDSPGHRAALTASAADAAEPATTRAAAATSATTTTEAKTTTPPTLATVVVTAARGDCWISARLGSEKGPLLEERLLARGESVTLRGARVWMSIGASGNVDVTVNGQERDLQSGTVAVVLTPA